MSKRRKCARCRRMFPAEQLINWLSDDIDETLSPNYCARCYSHIIDNYEEGDDVESMG